MKNSKFYSVLFTTAILFSCSNDDKTIDDVLNNTERGAILRTISTTDDMVYNAVNLEFEAGSGYTLELEEQDEQNGGLLGSVNVYARFIDNTLEDTNGDGAIDDNDDDFSTDETLIRTVQGSEFSPGPNGFPRVTISFTAGEMVAATVINDDLIKGVDQFGFRLELVLTDGRTYTNNASGNVSGGSFFSSPFEYRSNVSCSITENLSGMHTYVTTNMVSASGQTCADMVAGTVTWGDSQTPGVYTTSDLSFGQFESCGGDAPATTDEAMVEWSCSVFETLGEDQNENAYAYTITNVDGAEMTIEWKNDNGDSGTTVLTREGGTPWPAIFLDNNE